MANVKKVTLKTKTSKTMKTPRTKEFSIDQANAILKLPNTQWILDDKSFKWNGTEISASKNA